MINFFDKKIIYNTKSLFKLVNGVGMNYYCGYKNEKYKKNIDEFKKNGFTIFQNYFKDSQVEELGKMIVQGYNKLLDSKINHKNISRLICKYERKNMMNFIIPLNL